MMTFTTLLLSLRAQVLPRTKRNGSAMVVCLHSDGVSVVAVSAVARTPRVELARFYPCEEATRSSTLQQIAKEWPARGAQCSTLLSPGQYQIATLEAPKVPQSEQKTAVRWLLKDLIDYPSSEAAVDVLAIPSNPDATGRPASVFAVFSRSSNIRKLQTCLLEGSFSVKVIDIPETAQRNVASFAEDIDRALALVSFDKEGGLLTITCDGELYTARRIDVSTEQISQQDLAQRHASLERVALEIQRSLDHFDRQFNHITVSKLCIAPMAAVNILKDQLEISLYVPVEVLNIADIVDISAVPGMEDPAMQQQFFLSIGAALRNMERSL
jgi:MSHA biogenesis protein MshI